VDYGIEKKNNYTGIGGLEEWNSDVLYTDLLSR
jgi:hypothetical protein